MNTKMKTKHALCGLLSVLLLLAAVFVSTVAPAHAGLIIAFDPNVSHTDRADGPYSQGTLFRVDQAGGILLTKLGVQDVGDDGFSGSAPVGLWNANGTTLLASATVSGSDLLIDHYRYVTLATPVTLTAGTSYLLGSVAGGSFPTFSDGFVAGTTYSPFSAASPGITLLKNAYGALSPSLVAPLTFYGDGSRIATANAMFEPVPEPGTAVFGLACVGVAALRRRRRA